MDNSNLWDILATDYLIGPLGPGLARIYFLWKKEYQFYVCPQI